MVTISLNYLGWKEILRYELRWLAHIRVCTWQEGCTLDWTSQPQPHWLSCKLGRGSSPDQGHREQPGLYLEVKEYQGIEEHQVEIDGEPQGLFGSGLLKMVNGFTSGLVNVGGYMDFTGTDCDLVAVT